MSALCSVSWLLLGTSGEAQNTPRSTLGARKAPLPTTDELIKSGPKTGVETAADALGMVRGAQRSTTSVNTVEFTGTGTIAEPAADGTWREYKLTRLTAGFDLVLPAARFDIERVAAAARPQRQIRVVSGNRAWNEAKPGINGTPIVDGAADRVREISLTPHGAMWGALRAVESNNVRLSNKDGRLVIAYSSNGDPLEITLNADLLPERVRIQAHNTKSGDTVFESTHTRYKDFEGYLFYCPSRMIYKTHDHTILDLTVSDCVVNPYVVFPPPVNMTQAVPAR
jgi:hypothetical protein